MLNDPGQNIRQSAARFTRGDEVHVDRRKNSRKFAQRLRKAAAINQGPVQCAGYLLQARMLQTFLEDGESFVERHARLQQLAELFGKDEKLSVRDFKFCVGNAGAAV